MATRSDHIQFIELFPAKPTSRVVPESKTEDNVPFTSLPGHLDSIPVSTVPEPRTVSSPIQEHNQSGTNQPTLERTQLPAQEKSNKQPGPTPRANTKVTIIKNIYKHNFNWTADDVLKPIYTHSIKPKTLEVRFDMVPKVDNLTTISRQMQPNHHVLKFPIMQNNNGTVTLHQHTQDSVNKLVSQIEQYINSNGIQYVIIPYSGKDTVSCIIPQSQTEDKTTLLPEIKSSYVLNQINIALNNTFFSKHDTYTVSENNSKNNAIETIVKKLNENASVQAPSGSTGTATHIGRKEQSHGKKISKPKTHTRTSDIKGKSEQSGTKDNIITRLSEDNKTAYNSAIKTIQDIKKKDEPVLNANNTTKKTNALISLYNLHHAYPKPNLANYTYQMYNIVTRGPTGRGRGSGGRGNGNNGRGRGAVPTGVKVTICKNTFDKDKENTFTNVVFKTFADKSTGQLFIVFGKKTDDPIKKASLNTPYIKYTIPSYKIDADNNTVDVIKYTQDELNKLFADLAKYIADNNIGVVLINYTNTQPITVSINSSYLNNDNLDKLRATLIAERNAPGKTVYSMINEAIYYTFDNHPDSYDIVYNPKDTKEKHDTYNEKYKNPVNKANNLSTKLSTDVPFILNSKSIIPTVHNTTNPTSAQGTLEQGNPTNVNSPTDNVNTPEEHVKRLIKAIKIFNTKIRNEDKKKRTVAQKQQYRTNLETSIKELQQLVNENKDLLTKFNGNGNPKVNDYLSMKIPQLVTVNNTSPANQVYKGNNAPGAHIPLANNSSKNKHDNDKLKAELEEYNNLKAELTGLISEKTSRTSAKQLTFAVAKEITDNIAKLKDLLDSNTGAKAKYDADTDFKTLVDSLTTVEKYNAPTGNKPEPKLGNALHQLDAQREKNKAKRVNVTAIFLLK